MTDEYLVVNKDMQRFSPNNYNFKADERDFQFLVRKEALKNIVSEGKEPETSKYLKKFGFEWENLSDRGHMRYQPLAAFLFDIVSDYSYKIVDSLGLDVYRIKGTNLFNLDNPAVKEHAELFGDRLYTVEVDDKKFVMRYATCHQQFSALRNWEISYKNLPFAVFDIGDAYRLEQSGELMLCFRTRKMHMPDLHILCKNMDEAKEITLTVNKKIFEELNKKLGRNLVNIYNTTEEFFENNQNYIRSLLEFESNPILVKFVPENKYYWVINVEHGIIDSINNPREIGTFQIDGGNAKRFGITYSNKNCEKQHPPIIHTAIIGTIERYLYAVFDTEIKKKQKGDVPQLPLWMSPIQLRLIPVTSDSLDYAFNVANNLHREKIRVDIDDRNETINRKIMDSEKEWVPYMGIVGKREINSNTLSVRERKSKKNYETSIESLVKKIKKEVENYPYRPSNLPMMISKRPKFRNI